MSTIGKETHIDIELAERFLTLFDPNPTFFGTTELGEGFSDAGKRDSSSFSKHGKLTSAHIIEHLGGKNGYGAAPIWPDNTAKFGAIDIDVYQNIDHSALAKHVAELEIPLFVCRTKSGAAHIYLFLEERAPASSIVGFLTHVDKELQNANVYTQDRKMEIFPKQTKLSDGVNPSWINLPYFSALNSDRYCVDAVGNTLSLEDFVEQVESEGLACPDDIAQFVQSGEEEHPSLVDSWSAAVERLATDYPKESGRSEATVYLAGGLIRSGWEPKPAQDFIDALHLRIGDEEANTRTHIAKMTARKWAEGGEVAGWPKLASLIGWEVIEDTCLLLNILPIPLTVDRIEERLRGGRSDLDILARLIGNSAFRSNEIKAASQLIAQHTGRTIAQIRAAIDSAIAISAATSERLIVEELNASFAHVIVGDSPRIVWQRAGERHQLIKKQALVEHFAGQRVLLPGAGWVNKAAIWFNSPHRKGFERRVFKPGIETPRDFNTWQGFHVTPSKDGTWELLKSHIFSNVASGNEDHGRWIITWFAQLFQYPMEKSGTALVILGRQGTGKTIVGKAFGHLIKHNYMLAEDPKLVIGSFNQHLEDLLLLHADEAIFAKDRAAMARLRGLVTDDRQAIEPKGINAYSVDNYTRVLITTQQSHAVETNLDERRFAIFKIADNAQQNRHFFGEMMKELNGGGYERLLHDLLNLDLSNMDVGRIPITSATRAQVLSSLSGPTLFIFEMLQQGHLPSHVLHNQDDDGWPKQVDKSSLHEAYLDWARKLQQRYPEDRESFFRTWKQFFPVHVVKQRKLNNPSFKFTPHEGYVLPKGRRLVLDFAPLSLMRQLFSEGTKIKVEFDE